MSKRKTQKEKVMEYLEKHGSITQLEATNALRIIRLGAIIYILRSMGKDIITTLEVGKSESGNLNHYARYFLNEKK